MSEILPHLGNAATWTVMQQAGNANANGTSVDLKDYKGPVTFVLAVGQSTHGVGTLNVANIQTFTADTAGSYADVTGGNFAAVVNTANASNCGIQTKTFDVRALSRWVRCPIEVSGTNANIPISLHVIGQKERIG